MLRNPLTWLLLLIASTALAACCGSVPCDCRDELDDALIFQFNLDASTPTSPGFNVSELGTVYIRRVPLDTAQRPRADTVAITGGRRDYVQTVLINNNTPFPQSSSRKLNGYRYKIYVGTRKAPTDTFSITNVVLNDTTEADGCCSCNANVRKNLRVNGQFFDLADPSGNDRPDTVLLNRKR
ncbi:hypothetical protein [Hymenobacter sp.]|jgi:hypothetical protein|uniref:hypothetical protein n=1 Tax=Hymenobacter sp. TaxID=1898978 RepID=UPI002EDA4B71